MTTPAESELKAIMQQKTVSIPRLKRVLKIIHDENDRKTKIRIEHLRNLQKRVIRQRKLLGGWQRDNQRVD